MSHCTVCGCELHDKFLENEGMIPFCDHCGEFRFPMFNTAISTIVYDPSGEHIALIQQYGRKRNILVAGYVTKGEGVEQTLVREVKEELGLNVVDYRFNASEYFEPSNTLMVNFACRVDSDRLDLINEEVDEIHWYTPQEARENILHNSLAERFLLTWLKKQETFPPTTEPENAETEEGEEASKEEKVQNILCFGDSNTYGHNPVDSLRLKKMERWPGILSDLLGDGYQVIEEGCNGRTTIYVDPQEPWKCGRSYLEACLNTHKPIDQIIMMLGTNDMKEQFHATAQDIARGAGELIDLMKSFTLEKQGFQPKILLIAPPEIKEGISEMFFGHSFSERSVEESKHIGACYKEIAEEKACDFLDAAQIVVASEEDHLHLMPVEHRKLAQAIAAYLRQ